MCHFSKSHFFLRRPVCLTPNKNWLGASMSQLTHNHHEHDSHVPFIKPLQCPLKEVNQANISLVVLDNHGAFAWRMALAGAFVIFWPLHLWASRRQTQRRDSGYISISNQSQILPFFWVRLRLTQRWFGHFLYILVCDSALLQQNQAVCNSLNFGSFLKRQIK